MISIFCNISSSLKHQPPIGTHRHYPPPFFSVKVTNVQSENKAKSTGFELQVSSPAGKWKLSKTYKQVEELASKMTQLYHKSPQLAKHSTFEPLFFGAPDHTKATMAVQKFIDLVCGLPYSEFAVPLLDFLTFDQGLDSLNQMSKVREYKNKHGMTLTHFKMESGLELNYALFSRDKTLKGNTDVNMSVLEGWETVEMYNKRLARQRANSGSLDKAPAKEASQEMNLKQPTNPTPEEEGTKPSDSQHRANTVGGTTTSTNGTNGTTVERRTGPVSSTGSFENTIKDLVDGVEALVKQVDEGEAQTKEKANSGHASHNGDQRDPMKSPRMENQAKTNPNIVSRESLKERDDRTRKFQKSALGIFHKKHISRNIDCVVTCFETFSEADLIIAGLENGKIAAFKEVVSSDTDEFGLELLSKVKVFKEAVTHISLNSASGVLYCVGDKDTLAVIDLVSWKVIDKQALGGTVTEFLFDEDYQVALVANGQSKITILDLSDTKKFAKNQLKVGEDSSASIRHMDLDSEAGLIFCSDHTSGAVSVFDIDYPFSFQSKITKKSSAFGFSSCQDLSWWEARKEVYCGFKGGIVTVHRLPADGKLEFVTSCRVANADLHLVAHFGSCPYLFTASTDGCLTLWSPPQRWLLPFDSTTSPSPTSSSRKDSMGCEGQTETKERNHSPANSC